MTLQEEFDYYEKKLLDNNRVQHIKANYDKCNYCKRVADLHTMCARFNEKAHANATLGIKVFARLASAAAARLRLTDAELQAIEER